MSKSMLLLGILFFTTCKNNTPNHSQKPNILFVFADDQRADAMGLMHLQQMVFVLTTAMSWVDITVRFVPPAEPC